MSLNKSKGNMYEWITHTWNTVKGECLSGPGGGEYRIKKIGFLTWLHRILSKDKYYNAKLTLIAEE